MMTSQKKRYLFRLSHRTEGDKRMMAKNEFEQIAPPDKHLRRSFLPTDKFGMNSDSASLTVRDIEK